jgi:hypothetical protein
MVTFTEFQIHSEFQTQSDFKKMKLEVLIDCEKLFIPF